MSFRRFVGKVLHVTAFIPGGGTEAYLAKLSSYDDSGIWIERREQVHLPEGQTEEFDGLLFVPLSQIASVFASEAMDDALRPDRAAPGGTG